MEKRTILLIFLMYIILLSSMVIINNKIGNLHQYDAWISQETYQPNEKMENWSQISSNILIILNLIFSTLISLNLGKIFFKEKKLFLGVFIILITFILCYFTFPGVWGLIDSQVDGGYRGFINLESIVYFLIGIMYSFFYLGITTVKILLKKKDS